MKSKVFFGLTPLWCGLLILGSISPLEAEAKATSADSVRKATRHLSFGTQYLRTRRYKDAKTHLTRAWNFDPKNGITAYHLGKLYYELEKQDEAITWFRRSIELAPESKNVPHAYRSLAELTGKDTEKEVARTRETAADSGSGAFQHLSSGIRYLKKKRYKEAETELMKAWGLGPNERVAYFLHKLYHESRQYDQAIAWFRRGAELAPEDIKKETAEEEEILEFWQVETKPILIKSVKPIYPDIARKAGLTGKIFVKFLVGKDGRVKQVQVLKGQEIFRQAAIDAVSQFVFKPATQNNKPISVWMMQSVKFFLNK